MKRFIPLLLACCALPLAISTNDVRAAENIRLSNGQFVQGTPVGAPTESGMTFRLTRTGGEVFLRWSQIHPDDARRLRQIEDVESALDLTVRVPGQRLLLVTGEVVDGYIQRTASGDYTLTNLRNRGGRTIPAEDVEEFFEDAQIDAVSVMPPEEVLERRLEASPPDSAGDYYELARLAERLGMARRAKEFIEMCLASGPSAAILSRAEEFDSVLDELIRQEHLLAATTEARRLARQRQFVGAIGLIDAVIEQDTPTGAVLERLNELRAELDHDYTVFVVSEWFNQMSRVAGAKVRDMTGSEAVAYARRGLTEDIMAEIAATVGSEDTRDIQARFVSRRDLERERKMHLQTRRASFGRDGWYAVAGGPLPMGGNVQQSDPGGRDGSNRGRGGGTTRSGDRGTGGRRTDRDGLPDIFDSDTLGPASADGVSFQQGGNLPDGRTIRDFLDELERRQREGGGANEDRGGGVGPQRLDPDDPRMQVPDNTPAFEDWWERAGRTVRRNWVIAFYVNANRDSLFIIVDQQYETIRHK